MTHTLDKRQPPQVEIFLLRSKNKQATGQKPHLCTFERISVIIEKF